MTIRNVRQVVRAHRQAEGGGFIVRRPFPTQGLMDVDPFLLLDEMGPADYAPGEAIGAPDHPHRGFETVTYMLEGEFEHEDSAGHKGTLRAGDVQWMTAGHGVIHSEMPSARIMKDGGRVHGFQIWVNLPKRDKLMKPRYQEIPSSKIPTAQSPDGKVKVRVIAGEAMSVSAVIETRTPIVYQDWQVAPGGAASVKLDPKIRAIVYVFFGGARFGSDEKLVSDGSLAMLSDGDEITFRVPPDAEVGARFLLLGGEALNEPIVRHGPFVMNDEVEIRQAILDYQFGRLGQITRG